METHMLHRLHVNQQIQNKKLPSCEMATFSSNFSEIKVEKQYYSLYKIIFEFNDDRD